jgi:hypothetical protein
MTSHRVLRHYSALLCLLAACAAPTPRRLDQVVIPFEPHQVPELLREFSIARACGFDFVVGVSSAAHQTALRREMPNIKLVLTGC